MSIYGALKNDSSNLKNNNLKIFTILDYLLILSPWDIFHNKIFSFLNNLKAILGIK
jgi:hypothetical protein